MTTSTPATATWSMVAAGTAGGGAGVLGSLLVVEMEMEVEAESGVDVGRMRLCAGEEDDEGWLTDPVSASIATPTAVIDAAGTGP
jgi:hypothetical protein